MEKESLDIKKKQKQVLKDSYISRIEGLDKEKGKLITEILKIEGELRMIEEILGEM